MDTNFLSQTAKPESEIRTTQSKLFTKKQIAAYSEHHTKHALNVKTRIQKSVQNNTFSKVFSIFRGVHDVNRNAIRMNMIVITFISAVLLL
jgi:hypothetical protein